VKQADLQKILDVERNLSKNSGCRGTRSVSHSGRERRQALDLGIWRINSPLRSPTAPTT